ncbi:MAG: Hpt domain-containing protein [Halorhodospira sp.]
MSQQTVIDLEELLDNLGRDEYLVDQLLGRMAQDLPARLEALRDAFAQADPQAVHQISHPIKGSLASVRALEARERAQRLDDAARSGDLEAARAELPGVEAAAERLLAHIHERLRRDA